MEATDRPGQAEGPEGRTSRKLPDRHCGLGTAPAETPTARRDRPPLVLLLVRWAHGGPAPSLGTSYFAWTYALRGREPKRHATAHSSVRKIGGWSAVAGVRGRHNRLVDDSGELEARREPHPCQRAAGSATSTVGRVTWRARFLPHAPLPSNGVAARRGGRARIAGAGGLTNDVSVMQLGDAHTSGLTDSLRRALPGDRGVGVGPSCAGCRGPVDDRVSVGLRTERIRWAIDVTR
jgi:hypothetical protein